MIRTALLLALLVAGLGGASPAFGQSAVTWVRSYPQLGADGCTWVVATWSDGSFSQTPWDCPTNAPAQREDGVGAERSYPELGPGGCVWYVTQWADGQFSAVPFECPAGVVAAKPGTGPSAVAAPVAPPTATPTPRPNQPGIPGSMSGNDPPLRPIALGGFIRILEVTPQLGSGIAASGRMSMLVEHHISGIPNGWRVGYRIVFTGMTEDRRYGCRDCYLTEGLLDATTDGYRPEQRWLTWLNFRDASVVYQSMTICVTAINPFTREVRISNVCATQSV
ncbi:MAG: hypothetical protein KatS3mg060_1874 [Dehalococcoidia bacterium]|jgi:hypothetical protein|nr:MAG: hypothetical protein KatS3mg060_1874 [Dehalococcoidia bacterium]